MVFGIRNNLCLFARIRYKMTSKMIANGRFWMGDCLLDRAVIRETGKRACFRGPIGIYSRRVSKEILSSVRGMQQACSEGGDAWIISPSETPFPRSGPGSQPSLIHTKPSLNRQKTALLQQCTDVIPKCPFMSFPVADRFVGLPALCRKGLKTRFDHEGLKYVIPEWRRCRRHLRLKVRWFFRRTPTAILHQSWGCSWFVVRGDAPGSSLSR